MVQRKEGLHTSANRPGTFPSNIGIFVTDAGEDWAEAQLQAGAESLNLGGIVHGGCILTIMDQVTGYLANSGNVPCVTLSCQAKFLRPTQPGLVTARAEVLHRGEDQVLVQVQVTDQTGEVTAEGTYIYQRTKIVYT